MTFSYINSRNKSHHFGFVFRTMLLKRVIFLSSFIFLILSDLYSQLSVSGVPYSVTHHLPSPNTYELLPLFENAKAALMEEQRDSRLKRLKFAHAFEVALNPENSGQWISLDGGEKLWRLGIVSKGAYSLSLIFGTFNLEARVKIYVYHPNKERILGAYSNLNNNAAGIVAVEPLQGDSLIVEMNVPSFVKDYGRLQISKVGHGFVNIFGGMETFSTMQLSGACNVDINCESGSKWQREKYAVCKLFVYAEDLCTGTLINNTSKDGIPYILTANHCINSEDAAHNTVFSFSQERWKCGLQGGPRPISLSGAMMRATTPQLDFSLVQLYTYPPFSAHPYYAGWDRSNTPPLSSAIIHHPGGDFKKISIDNDPAVSATFEEDYNPNTHWMVNRWDVGTTEGGSSGGPMFNQNHLVVGDLTGGDATCASPVKDYFAKLSNSWADYTAWNRQLKHWLDPMNTDSVRIMGMDPFIAEKASCDTIETVAKSEKLRLYNTNLLWGSYSGHNSDLYTQFAEKIDEGGHLKISGFYVNPATVYRTSDLAFVRFKLWKDGAVPGDEITVTSVYLRDITPKMVNYFSFDSTIFVDGPVYLGYSLEYAAKSDTFALYQAEDRGASGYSGMFLFKEGVWKNISQVTSPSIHSSLSLGLISCSLVNSISEKEVRKQTLKVYPNPVSAGMINAEVPSTENIDASVYDLMGRKAPVKFKTSDNLLTLDVSGLSQGLYILKVMIPGMGFYNARFLIIK